MAWDTEKTSQRNTVSKDQGGDAPEPHGRQWHTLKKRSDFLRVRAAGLRGVMPGFVLQAAPTLCFQRLRVGFTASKKVGNAIARNRAKRRLRALADNIMSVHADPNFDYVLIGRTETLRRSFSSMENELRRTLKSVCTKREKQINATLRTDSR